LTIVVDVEKGEIAGDPRGQRGGAARNGAVASFRPTGLQRLVRNARDIQNVILYTDSLSILVFHCDVEFVLPWSQITGFLEKRRLVQTCCKGVGWKLHHDIL